MDWNSDTIRKLRMLAEMSQEEFAKRLGVSKLTVMKWETKPSALAIEKLEGFAKELDFKEE